MNDNLEAEVPSLDTQPVFDLSTVKKNWVQNLLQETDFTYNGLQHSEELS